MMNLDPFAYCTSSEFKAHVETALKRRTPKSESPRGDLNILLRTKDLIDEMGLTQDVYEELRDQLYPVDDQQKSDAEIEATNQQNTLTCVYCGHAYPPGTPTHGAKVLTDHIAKCPKHPMHAVVAENARLRELMKAALDFIHATYEDYVPREAQGAHAQLVEAFGPELAWGDGPKPKVTLGQHRKTYGEVEAVMLKKTPSQNPMTKEQARARYRALEKEEEESLTLLAKAVEGDQEAFCAVARLLQAGDDTSSKRLREMYNLALYIEGNEPPN